MLDPSLPSQLGSTRLNSLEEYFFAKANQRIAAVEATGRSVINLGIGSPDLPPPPAFVQELVAQVQNPAHYRYPGYHGLPQFNQAIAKWYHNRHGLTIDPQTMSLPLAGSKEGLFFLSLALVSPGEEILIPNPGYSTYGKAAELVGATTKEYALVAEQEYFPDLEALEKQDLSRVKLMWINYPHNPTGAVISREQYQTLVEFSRRHQIILASDNPYSEVTFDGFKAATIMEVVQPEDLVVELNSMSKTYNLAGVRLGWAVGHPALITALKIVYSNIETGIFTALQAAGTVALEVDQEWLEERNAVYAARRELALQVAHQLGCTAPAPLAALYVWARLPATVAKAEEYCFDLLEKTGVFVTPGTAFGSNGEGNIRISLCQPVEVFHAALQQIGSR